MPGLSKELIEKIQKEIDNAPCKMYWDYQDREAIKSNTDIIEQILDGKYEDAVEEIFESMVEIEWRLRRQIFLSAIEDFEDEIMEELAKDYDEFDPEMILDMIEDELECSVDYDLEHLLGFDVPVRVTLYSNYDSMGSFWAISHGGVSYEDSYLKGAVDLLKLNPRKLKEKLIEAGIPVSGRWPNRKARDGNELVSYDDFISELVNTTSEGNLLTFLITVDLYEYGTGLLDGKPYRVFVPDSTPFGFFAPGPGAGSMFEGQTLKAHMFKLGQVGPTEYDRLEIVPDFGDRWGYTTSDVYGWSREDIFEGGYVEFKSKKGE